MNLKTSLLVLLTSLIIACSQPTPLQSSMEGIAKGLKAVARGKTDEEKQAGLAKFKESIALAKLQKVKPEDQAQFDEGVTKLAEKLPELEAAVKSGDKERLMAVVKAYKKLQEQYHEAIIDEKH